MLCRSYPAQDVQYVAYVAKDKAKKFHRPESSTAELDTYWPKDAVRYASKISIQLLLLKLQANILKSLIK